MEKKDAIFTGFIFILPIVVVFCLGLFLGWKTLYVLCPLVFAIMGIVRTKEKLSFWGALSAVLLLFPLVGFGSCMHACSTSFEYEEYTDNSIWIYIGIAIFLLSIGIWIWSIGKYEVNEKKRIQKKKQKIQIEHEKYLHDEEEKKKNKRKELERQYGKLVKEIDYDNMHIKTFDDSKTIIINDHLFSYDEIQNCTINVDDEVNSRVIPGKSTSTYATKTSGSSMVVRALVGAAIAGPVGAVIGGVTAKKETVGLTTTTPDKVIKTHTTNYYVAIITSNAHLPLIGYKTDSQKQANDIVSTINEIIEKKNYSV